MKWANGATTLIASSAATLLICQLFTACDKDDTSTVNTSSTSIFYRPGGDVVKGQPVLLPLPDKEDNDSDDKDDKNKKED